MNRHKLFDYVICFYIIGGIAVLAGTFPMEEFLKMQNYGEAFLFVGVMILFVVTCLALAFFVFEVLK